MNIKYGTGVEINIDGNEKETKTPITHETFLVGFTPEGEVSFFKSYDYLNQKDEALADATWVQNNCHHWEFGAAKEFKLTHEELIHDIVIQHP